MIIYNQLSFLVTPEELADSLRCRPDDVPLAARTWTIFSHHRRCTEWLEVRSNFRDFWDHLHIPSHTTPEEKTPDIRQEYTPGKKEQRLGEGKRKGNDAPREKAYLPLQASWG